MPLSQSQARSLSRLTNLAIRKLKKPGICEDGGGLRLVVGQSLRKCWVMRVTISGVRRERGLGGFASVSLEDARFWSPSDSIEVPSNTDWKSKS